MKVLILAAGKGERLMPLTSSIPKPFLPLGSSTIIGKLIDQISGELPVEEFMINVHHGEDYAIRVLEVLSKTYPLSWRREDELRGPLGSLLTFKDKIDAEDDLLVVSGDAWLRGSLSAFWESHAATGAVMTLLTVTSDDCSQFGVVETDSSGCVLKVREKPQDMKKRPGLISAGVYCISGQLLDLIPRNRPSDYCLDLVPLLLAAGQDVRAVRFDGKWDDLGAIDRYLNALLSLAHETHTAANLANIHRTATLSGRVHLSPDSSAGAHAILHDSALMPGARIRPHSIVSNEIRNGT